MDKNLKLSSIANIVSLLMVGILILFYITRVEKQVLPLQHELAGLDPVRAILKFEIGLVQSTKPRYSRDISSDWKLLRGHYFSENHRQKIRWNTRALDEVDHQIYGLKSHPEVVDLGPVFIALNSVILSLADASELILDPNVTRYHLIELLTRNVSESVTNINGGVAFPQKTLNIERMKYSLAVGGIPMNIQVVCRRFVDARSADEAIRALDDLTEHLTEAIRDLIQAQIQGDRLSEAVAVLVGLLAALISLLLLNSAFVLRTSAYTEIHKHTLRAMRSICLMAILGDVLAILVWPSDIVRWPYYLNIGVASLVFLVSVRFKLESIFALWVSIFGIVGFVFFSATITAVQSLKSGSGLQIFLAFKFVPLIIALFSLPPAACSLFLIVASGLIPIFDYFFLFSPALQAVAPIGEPWLALEYSAFALIIFLYRNRETRIERELIQALNEKKAAEKLLESESRFRRLVESNILGVVRSTVFGEVIDANQYFLDLVGYSREDFKTGGVGWTHITAPEFRTSQIETIREIQTHGSVPPYEKAYIRKDGKRVWVLVGAALLEGTSRELVTFVIDTTEKKNSEKLLQEERERLLVKETHARKEAEKTVKLRNDFIALASHELRTPLTPLKALIQICGNVIGSPKFLAQTDSSDVLELINKCKLQVERIHYLAEAMITAVQIDNSELVLNRKNCDLSELILHVLSRYRNDFKQAKCTLDVNLPEGITGFWDQDKLEQTLGNLLQNAIKFGPNGTIEVKASISGEFAEIIVRDHGIGLPLRVNGNIFDRFQRNVPIESYGGLGLGLYIAKHIVEAHRGSIHGERGTNEGATFTIHLPVGSESKSA